MELRTKKYLYDISQAAGNVMEFTTGKTFADYERDLMLRLAVERAFEIIGEAVARLARFDEATAERISDYQAIIAFRNLIAHDYDELKNATVWEKIERHVPTLRRETEGLLGE